MKCVILGLDALEYNFVEKFDLKNLKQQEYGKVRIPRECFTDMKRSGEQEPLTPLVWISFLTGKLPTQIGFFASKWDNRILNIIRPFPRRLGLNRIKGKGKIFEFLGFRKRPCKEQDYASLFSKVSTFFDLTEKAYAINVPFYSEDWRGWGIGISPDDFGNFKDFIATALDNEAIKFNSLKTKALQFLEQNHDWNLLMVYFKTLDTYGELSFGTASFRDMYAKVDSFVKEVKQRANGSFVLVISDHGIRRLGKTPFGRHSNYAFYSINKELGLSNPKVTDFYYIISRMLDRPCNRHLP